MALVSVETLLLVLLVVLVAGLLRSHAEILRRLGRAADGEGPDPVGARAAARFPGASRSAGVSRSPGDSGSAGASSAARAARASRLAPDPPAPSLAGATPGGDAIKLGFDGATATPTLLAFLSSGCSTCAVFWEGLDDRRVAPEVQTVIVTHGAERERSARLRSLAPTRVPVVMSSRAWEDYGVPGSPYFVLVNGSVRGEGVATSWTALASLVGDAIEDEREVENVRGSGAPDLAVGRARPLEATLAAGGVGPDHPSLRPRRP
ncbi:MAG: TlpA family protein disulfide reductase [Solirubrobacteraceae bacterium]